MSTLIAANVSVTSVLTTSNVTVANTLTLRGANVVTVADTGIVNTSMLAANSVTVDKLGTTTKLVKFTQIINNTRQSFTVTTENIFWSPSYTKERSDSFLLIQMSLATFGAQSYSLNWYARYAGSSWFLGSMPNVASSVGYNMRQSNEYLITGVTNVGANTLDIRWNTANLQAGNAPASIWNPNSADEGRLAQQFSSLNIWEIV